VKQHGATLATTSSGQACPATVVGHQDRTITSHGAANGTGVTTLTERSQWQQVADELEIRNLVAELAHMADMASEDDLSDYISRFTEDARWEMRGNEVCGRDDILAAARQRRASGTQGPGTNSRHVITTQSVRLDGDDRATGEAYFLFVGDTDTTPQVKGIGHYCDRFLRTPEGWKLMHRTITFG
jgi:3-phenylpropionate/cinnamic acid dioxygenase small subunit